MKDRVTHHEDCDIHFAGGLGECDCGAEKIAALEAALREARRQHDSRCEEYRRAHLEMGDVVACVCGADAHNARIDAALEKSHV